jgi:uncharacterized membrane protein
MNEKLQEAVVKRVVKGTKSSQTLEVTVDGKKVVVETGAPHSVRRQTYGPGDKLLVGVIDQSGTPIYYVKDYVRTDALFSILLLFVFCVVIVAKRKGIFSLLGMGVSFALLLVYTLPALVTGVDPVSVSLITAGMLVPLTFYVSHGFSKKTHIAVISSLMSLAVVVILSVVWIEWAKLTGYSTEEATFLDVMTQGKFDMRGILLSGIIIGSIGILDDVTVSQIAIVEQLREVGKIRSSDELFKRAMKIGGDHISSMVNTLILVYTGAALPLLLLFIVNPQPAAQVVQYEMIAEEIIRSLIGSIGLIVSVPLATYIASKNL